MPIIDDKPKIREKDNAIELKLNEGNISFEKINFSYSINEDQILKNINLSFQGKKMTALVGRSGAGNLQF